MPARFEADGAFTLGCSLWDTPVLEPFSDDNPDIAMISLFLNGDRESGYSVQAFIDKRGDGMVLLTGTHCGVSIDWSSFDSQRQKGERPKPGGN